MVHESDRQLAGCWIDGKDAVEIVHDLSPVLGVHTLEKLVT